jgi:lipoprotein NlpI
LEELEKKLQRLEAEKEILNRAIDIADEQLGTDIRKKYLALLSAASKQQGTDDTASA